VTGIVVTGGGWRSERGGLQAGAPVRTIRAALPGARLDRRGVHRALLPLGVGRVANVRITVRAGRVRRIEARDVARSALDRAGRALLRGEG
jgi:hypothetical protein